MLIASPTDSRGDDGSALRAASRAARAARLRIEAEDPDGPEYDTAVAADDDAMDAIVGARYVDDDRFFADAAHIIELAHGNKQDEEAAVALLKNYLGGRRRELAAS